MRCVTDLFKLLLAENLFDSREYDAADIEGRRGDSGLRQSNRKSLPEGSAGLEGNTGMYKDQCYYYFRQGMFKT